MAYCTSYQHNVEVKIPYSLISQFELYVVQLMLSFGGVDINLSLGTDGAMLIRTVIFDYDKRNEFCKTVESVIESNISIA